MIIVSTPVLDPRQTGESDRRFAQGRTVDAQPKETAASLRERARLGPLRARYWTGRAWLNRQIRVPVRARAGSSSEQFANG